MCKYNNHYFWKHIIEKKGAIWNNIFNDNSVRENYIFINTLILDYDNNIYENDWGCYPNIKSLLGFIQYVYMPTAFFNILNKEIEEVVVPIGSNEYFIEEIGKIAPHKEKEIKSFFDEIKNYWNMEEDHCIKSLKKFIDRFNEKWYKDNQVLSIKMFLSPQEIATYIIQNQGFEDVIEEEIGISKSQLLYLCNNLHKNEFMKKKFMNFLNNEVQCIIY